MNTRENRASRVTIRFTKTEYEILNARFQKTTCRQLAEFCRKLILGKPPTVFYRDKSLDDLMTELIKCRKDFNAIGNNLNQVVKKINAVNDETLHKIWLPYAKNIYVDILRRGEKIQEIVTELSKKWLQ